LRAATGLIRNPAQNSLDQGRLALPATLNLAPKERKYFGILSRYLGKKNPSVLQAIPVALHT
jgi:hypothetical protein